MNEHQMWTLLEQWKGKVRYSITFLSIKLLLAIASIFVYKTLYFYRGIFFIALIHYCSSLSEYTSLQWKIITLVSLFLLGAWSEEEEMAGPAL